ncbi:MAG: hypothetical protein FJ009_12705 [Chloroflexi bacterium]|nr:hypothetical protein [Chloroflexota bacterium]
MISLVDYLVARELPLPPIQDGRMFEYVLAANGVFVRGKRAGLEVMLPVTRFGSAGAVRALARLEPYVHLTYPRVPTHLGEEMLRQARAARNVQPNARAAFLKTPTRGRLTFVNPSDWIEVLFYLDYDVARGAWQLITPEQEQSVAQVVPVDRYDATHAKALIQLHSHHDFTPMFSSFDDQDHTGFQIYAVLGNLSTQPTLRVRVGLYGYWMDISAWNIFEPIEGVGDAQAG